MVLKLKQVFMPEFDEPYQKVQAWFFSFSSRQPTLSELSKTLNMSKTTANEAISRLVEEGFIIKEVIGRAWRLSYNRQHPHNFSRKIAFNLKGVYESGILDEIHKAVPNTSTIILFGSYRKGDDDEKSDLDLATEVLGNQELRILELGILPRFGYRTNVPVHLHLFSRNKVDLNLFANIANGIVLEGFLEVRP